MKETNLADGLGQRLGTWLVFALIAGLLVETASVLSIARGALPPMTALAKELETPNGLLKNADRLFKEQQWAEARTAYDQARQAESDWRAAPVRLAVEGGVACSLKLQQWDDALERAQQFIAHTKDSFEEAVGERFLAGLYLTIPHYGTKRGSVYLRGQWTQGTQVYSWRKDRKEALKHYERARELLLALEKEQKKEQSANPQLLRAERIGLDFDHASALAQQSHYQYGRWGWISWWWGPGFEDEEDSEAIEEADYEEPRWGYWNRAEQTPPSGIPLDTEGRPQFVSVPTEYDPNLGDGQKIRFLLAEIQQLDASEKKDDAARALLRWAMIAGALYGPETAQHWSGARVQYDRFGRPLPQEPEPSAPLKKVWELLDDEALTIAGGRVCVIKLPASESPITLLRLLEEKYPESSVRPEAHYARALYYQTRQQFPQALSEYHALIERYPQHKRAGDARQQTKLIEQAEVLLGGTGVYLPGAEPKLSFTYRNTDRLQFKAFRLDLVRYVQDRMEDKSENYWNYRNLDWDLFQKERWKRYMGEEVIRWTETVPRQSGNRVAEGATHAPLIKPGAYLVEANTEQASGSSPTDAEKGVSESADKAPVPQPTRVLVLVTDIAIVHKNAAPKGLIYLCDAVTGQPLANKAVRIYEHWSEWISTKQKTELHYDSVTRTTDTNGVIEYARRNIQRSSPQVDAVVVGEHNRMAFSFFQSWSEGDPGYYWEEGPRYYVVTDRPVYRPGDIVNFRAWIRNLSQRKYHKPSAESVRFEVYDAKNNLVKSVEARPDKFGGAGGKFELGEEPPLGVYHIRINGYRPDARCVAGALFRVEEYKKPEFEVTVKPAKTQARLGEKIKAKIEARYYFGTPVAQAEVSYKVFRENYQHVYWGPGEYDWLYGKGYGRYYYPYPWFPWWGRWGCYIWGSGWWPGWGLAAAGYYFPWGYYGDEESQWSRRYESGTRKALRELVAQGRAALAPDGTCEIEIDTVSAQQELGERDHRFTIEAEVSDASRRTIVGEGSVLVTRQEFYAFVETDGGWYQPKNEAHVEVRALTAENVPVAAKGEIVVARIRYRDANSQQVQEEVVSRWPAETDAQGRLSFRFPIPGEGQYRLTFKTQDSWNQEVQGNAVFWAYGPKFDGRLYRFNDLEIIADKRTYKVGDTAHLLINVAERQARVLFSDHVSRGSLLNYRFIDVPARSTVVDVPIGEQHAPNFYVEATLVRNGRIHTEAQELFVPPSQGLLNVALKTDKETYRTGETGQVQVAVTDWVGKPVRGQLILTVYDEAVTYIQDEFGPSPRLFFYGQKRQHQPYADASVNHSFGASGSFVRAEYFTYVGGGEPDGWRGHWNLESNGLSLSGGIGVGYGGADYLYDGRAQRIGGFAGAPTSALLSANQPMTEVAAKPSAPTSLAMAFDSSSMRWDSKGAAKEKDAALGPSGAPAFIEPEIRVNFADTALWGPALNLDEAGKAKATLVFPQSLTTWRVRGYAVTHATQVGDATATATTTKDLIVRLQSPRFFIERDEVVLSANAHNYLKTAKQVKAELIVPADLFEFIGPSSREISVRKEDNLHLLAEAVLSPNSEHRFDWLLKVKQAGLARITVKAMTDEQSDGMRLAFPVLVHGLNKTVAQSGSYQVSQEGDRTMRLELPAQIDLEQTRLEVTLAPSLAGVMIDALPYLIGYPYGCVEQTMSRFYPCVLVADTLKKMGTDLETIGRQRKQMNAGDLTNRFGRIGHCPAFDSAELDRMVEAGLQRIYSFQRNDGGWGWWREDDSSPCQTAYVLQGLHAARQAGFKVDGGIYDRGLNFLQNAIQKELVKPKDEQRIGDRQTQAQIAYVLSLEHRLQSDQAKKWLASLYETRGELNNYGRALLALAMRQEKEDAEAQTLLRNILQFIERDDSNQTAWVRTPETCWWFWWNNDIEVNAWALKALIALEPKNELAPRLVKWLLNNRRNGYYWRSTRDTALVIAAMTDYLLVSGEGEPNYTVTVSVDGQRMKEVTITKTNFFTFDNRLVLYGLQVKSGTPQVTLSKQGPGALYYSCYLSYFTKQEDITGAGNEINIARQYFKLVPKTESVFKPSATTRSLGLRTPAREAQAAEGSGRAELRAGWTRAPLNTGDVLASGDQIEVVLTLTSKNTYDYLVFEDMKPAGCEPVVLRSGGRWAGGLCANLELRDEKVVFFLGLLEQGQHVLRYRLRAETPGHFHALPASGFAMYAPEVRAISDEMRLRIEEK